MSALRALIRRHPQLAALVVAASLLLRILIPAGFMPMVSGGQILVSICSGVEASGIEVSLPLPVERDASDHPAGGKADQPCSFSGLSWPSLTAVDPGPLVTVLLFVVAMALIAATLLVITAAARLRPPSRGPPATA